MMLQPLNDIVFVQREPMPEVSEGGILLLAREDTKDRHKRTLNDFAKVIAVGSKCKDVKVGDRVYLGEWLGHDCEYQGVKYQAVHEKDIPAIIE